MAINTSTTPARAGERTRSLKSQIGPVTAAIRTMRKAERIDDAVQAPAALRQHDPEIDSIPAFRNLRTALADQIESDIALLDALAGDADLEADYLRPRLDAAGQFCFVGVSSDDEPSLCGVEVSGPACGGADLEEDAGDMPEDDPAEAGIADFDGLMEQSIARDSLVAL